MFFLKVQDSGLAAFEELKITSDGLVRIFGIVGGRKMSEKTLRKDCPKGLSRALSSRVSELHDSGYKERPDRDKEALAPYEEAYTKRKLRDAVIEGSKGFKPPTTTPQWF